MTGVPRWLSWLAAAAFAGGLLMAFVPGREAQAISGGLLWFASNEDNIPGWVNDLLVVLAAIGMAVAVAPALWRRQWGVALTRFIAALAFWSLATAIVGGYVVYYTVGWGWGTLWFFGWAAIALVPGIIAISRYEDFSDTTSKALLSAQRLEGAYVADLEQAMTAMGFATERTPHDSAFDLLVLNYPDAVCVETQPLTTQEDIQGALLEQLIKKAQEVSPIPVLAVTNSRFPPNAKELAKRDKIEFITWRDARDNDILRNALYELLPRTLPKAS